MEQRDIYDLYGQKTGKVVSRQEPLLPGEYCRTVCVCVFNSRGEMLLQKRTPDKALWANLWDITAAGGVMAGENGQQAAERELREEMGLEICFEGVRPKLTTYFRDGFSDVFTVVRDVELSQLTLQKEEVADARWASLDEIEVMMKEGTFIPYFGSYIRVLFELYEKNNVFVL